MTERAVEICVIGGGPAGTSAALRLAALGHEVCLIEREAFPRRRAGESLTPGVEGVFDALGVRDRLESAGIFRALPAEVRWTEERAARMAGGWRFVDRRDLDTCLLDAARAQGVEVIQPARARSAVRTPEGWRIVVEGEGRRSHVVLCSFAIDASGRAGFFRGERQSTSPRTVALHGYFRGKNLPEIAGVEAAVDGWGWGAPLPSELFSAMVFFDPATVRAAGRSALEALHRAWLGRSELFRACAGAPLEGALRVLDATPYRDASPVGPDWIKLGEASFALDPLSSTGVEKAMRSSLVGSVVVHTMRARPERAHLARGLYIDRQRESVEQHKAWSAAHYREGRYPDHPFWQRRGEAAPPIPEPQPPGALPGPEALHLSVSVAPRARLEQIACLVGDEIAPRSAITSPTLPRPVAFVEGVEIAPLLAMISPGEALHRVVRRWSAHLPPRKALAIAAWLLSREILVGHRGVALDHPSAATPLPR